MYLYVHECLKYSYVLSAPTLLFLEPDDSVGSRPIGQIFAVDSTGLPAPLSSHLFMVNP